MQAYTFVLIGRSGCGKGTQAEKIKEHLAKHDPTRPIIHVETGKLFREFAKGTKYTHETTKAITTSGGLAPEFLTVAMWARFLIENMVPDCHLIFDGTPRKFDEAHVLDTAFTFYKREKPYILFMEVDKETVTKRLLSRGREDDKPAEIANRLKWFDDEVTKVVDYYRTSPNSHFVKVDSSQSIDRVFHEIVAATGLDR